MEFPTKRRKRNTLDTFSAQATRWVGSTQSLIVHTVLFLSCFLMIWIGADASKVMLVLTTIVSLEAIYLSIFIQMSVNRSNRRLHAVSKDIDEIQEDVEGIEKDIDEIQRDVDEIQEDVEGIEKDIDEIQEDVEDIGEDVEEITEEADENEKIEREERQHEVARYERIEGALQSLLNEVATLKQENEALHKKPRASKKK